MSYRFIGLLLGLSMAATGHATVDIEEYDRYEFNPSRGQTFEIPVSTQATGTVEIHLYSPDGDRVRTLSTNTAVEAGLHRISWDGQDAQGTTVPDEAYVPVVRFMPAEGTAEEYDPREFSGGEELRIEPQVESSGQIHFQLERPARILARAGIRSGPMMASMANWQVRGPGRNIIPWNGHDRDGLVNLLENDHLALLVTGYELPRHSILTSGNSELSYRAWRDAHGWSSEMPDFSDVVLERDGRRVSRHFYLPRSADIDPRITLDLSEELPVNEAGIPVVSGPVTLRVNMHEEDRWAMQQSLYEVAFFIDQTFVSEEEQGYVPLSWRWNPAGLAPGVHVVTVNVSGFNGQVGVKSLKVAIPE